jgi:hypothetical protein
MKLDPGMHIDLHLVFFGKTGVTGMERGRDHSEERSRTERGTLFATHKARPHK